MNIHGRRSQTPISAFFDMIPMKTFTVVFILFHPFFLSYNIFYLFVFFFFFLSFILPQRCSPLWVLQEHLVTHEVLLTERWQNKQRVECFNSS